MAAADPGGLTPAQWDRQVVLEKYANTITTLGTNDATFSSVEIDAKTDAITVYLTKAPAGELSARYQGAAPRTTLRFGIARLSARQLTAMEKLVSSKRSALQAKGIKVVQYGMLDGPTGPYVVVYQGTAGKTATAAAVAEPTVLQAVQEFGAGTVTARVGHVNVLGRYDDTSPFWGGSNIVASNSGTKYNCTSGYAGRGNSNGHRYLTMAAHCVKRSDPRAWISNGTYIGPITSQMPFSYDTAVIDATAAGNLTAARIFDGGVDDDTHSKQVSDVAGFSQGLYVCVSGSYTRVICDARIQQQSVFIAQNVYDNTQYEVSVYGVRRDVNSVLVANGDSGGPVFSNANNNTTATGRGTIAGGIDPVLCPSYLSGHTCYRTALVVDLTRIASAFNINFSQ